MTGARTFLRGPEGEGGGGQNAITLGLVYAFASADARYQ